VRNVCVLGGGGLEVRVCFGTHRFVFGNTQVCFVCMCVCCQCCVQARRLGGGCTQVHACTEVRVLIFVLRNVCVLGGGGGGGGESVFRNTQVCVWEHTSVFGVYVCVSVCLCCQCCV